MTFDEFNPYAPPTTNDAVVKLPPDSMLKVLIRFREEVHAIAAGILFIATPAVFYSMAMADRLFDAVVGVMIAMAGIVLGTLVARKRLIAVRIALGLLYLMLAACLSLMPLGILLAIITGIAIAQCHRILQNARLLLQAQINLHTKPHELIRRSREAPSLVNLSITQKRSSEYT